MVLELFHNPSISYIIDVSLAIPYYMLDPLLRSYPNIQRVELSILKYKEFNIRFEGYHKQPYYFLMDEGNDGRFDVVKSSDALGELERYQFRIHFGFKEDVGLSVDV